MKKTIKMSSLVSMIWLTYEMIEPKTDNRRHASYGAAQNTTWKLKRDHAEVAHLPATAIKRTVIEVAQNSLKNSKLRIQNSGR